MTPYTYTKDKPKTAQNYRLLANPHKHYYPSRNKPILMGVMHITAGLDDYDSDDTSAEATLNYSTTTSVKASYHGIVDSDSIIDCLPDEYTAWAQGVVGYNFNSPSLSLEIGKATTDWRKAPIQWVKKVIANAAEWWAPRVIRWKIPLRLMTNRDEIQQLIDKNQPVGFTEHWRLDRANRWDAGRVGETSTFPWDDFFKAVKLVINRLLGKDEIDMATMDELRSVVRSELRRDENLQFITNAIFRDAKTTIKWLPVKELGIPTKLADGTPVTHIAWGTLFRKMAVRLGRMK